MAELGAEMATTMGIREHPIGDVTAREAAKHVQVEEGKQDRSKGKKGLAPKQEQSVGRKGWGRAVAAARKPSLIEQALAQLQSAAPGDAPAADGPAGPSADFVEAAAERARAASSSRSQLERDLERRRKAGDPTSTRQLDMSAGLPLPRSLVECTSAADERNERSGARLGARQRSSVRSRVYAESSVREVESRHRELVNEPGLRGRRLYEAELARHKARYAPPHGRFWALLALWLVGGLLGAHRLLARRWRGAALQFSCAALGTILVSVGATRLAPAVVVGWWTYEYDEAYVIGGIGIGFTTAGGLLWLVDGYLLRRGRLYLNGGESYDYTPFETKEWWRAAALWLGGGCFGAHRVWLRHVSQGCLHGALTAIGIAAACVGDFGDVDGAFFLAIFCGAAFLACAVMLWLRDLLQLLRGRLGPRPAARPAFWRLFFACVLLGPLGAHRLLLRRAKSAWCFPLAAAASVVLLGDLAAGWLAGGLGGGAALAVRAVEATGVALVGGALLAGWARDLRGVLRGTLVPAREGTVYWQVLYSWALLGVPAGIHRARAGHVTWKIFAILNAYGALLLALSEAGMRVATGDEGEVDPFDLATANVLASLAGLFLLIPVVMWLRDAPRVLRGTLMLRPEDPVFYSAVVTWLLPSGYLLGLHFRILGRPLDYQLFSSFSAVGATCAVGFREFARWGDVDKTYLFCLGAGAGAIGINVLRFAQESVEMRVGSVLARELSIAQFRRVRILFATTGLLCSGHQAWLGHPVASVLTVVLNCIGGGLVYVAQYRVAPLQDTADATLALGAIAGGAFLTTFALWFRDGLRLVRGKVKTAGEKVVVLAEPDDDPSDAQLRPPAHWRQYKTPAGHEYYFDPATERVHYLSATGYNNYAVDPRLNKAVVYDSLAEMEAKLARLAVGLPADIEEEDADAEGDGRAAAPAPTAGDADAKPPAGSPTGKGKARAGKKKVQLALKPGVDQVV